MNVKKIGLLAASAVTLLGANVVLAGEKTHGGPKVVDGMYCQNNSCSGKSACSGHGNEKGAHQNTCKGQGFLKFDKKEACEKNGGLWAAAKTAEAPAAAPKK